MPVRRPPCSCSIPSEVPDRCDAWPKRCSRT
jgi:hypothetical protein